MGFASCKPADALVERSFCSKAFVRNHRSVHTRTHRTDCSTWTTNVVGKIASGTVDHRTSFCLFTAVYTSTHRRNLGGILGWGTQKAWLMERGEMWGRGYLFHRRNGHGEGLDTFQEKIIIFRMKFCFGENLGTICISVPLQMLGDWSPCHCRDLRALELQAGTGRTD